MKFGNDPMNWFELKSKYSKEKWAHLDESSAKWRCPLRLFCFASKLWSVHISQMDFGISASSMLYPRLRCSRVVMFPKDSGMEPSKLLSIRTSSLRVEIFPKEFGMEPPNRLTLRKRDSREAIFSKALGIEVFIEHKRGQDEQGYDCS